MSDTYRWLLEVTPPNGPVLRYSTEALEVSKAAGGTLTYRAGLGDFSMSRGEFSASITITDAAMPGRRRIPGAVVRLYRHRVGDERERAELFIEGYVVDSEIGGDSEEVSFAVEPLHSDLPPMIDTDAVVDQRTATSAAGETIFGEIGKRYPLVFGWPGYSGFGTRRPALDTPWPVVPVVLSAYPADGTAYTTALVTARIVVNEDPRTTNPTTVLVRDLVQDVEIDEDTLFYTDGLGRKMVGADFSATGGNVLYPDSGNGSDVRVDYIAGFKPAADAAPMRSLYDVVYYLLERWGGNSVDWSRIPDVRDLLGPYNVDTWFNDTIEGGVWAWLEMLGATVPFGVRMGRGGQYLLPLRYTTDPARVVRTVDVSRGEVGRITGLRTKNTPVNKRTALIRDINTLNSGGYLTRLTLGSGASEQRNAFGLLLTEERVSGLCAASASRFGERVGSDVEIAWSWDEESGWRVLDWMAERDAFPAELVTYRVPESWQLREQDQVRLVDPSLDIDDYAIVSNEPSVGAEGAEVTFMIPGG